MRPACGSRGPRYQQGRTSRSGGTESQGIRALIRRLSEAGRGPYVSSCSTPWNCGPTPVHTELLARCTPHTPTADATPRELLDGRYRCYRPMLHCCVTLGLAFILGERNLRSGNDALEHIGFQGTGTYMVPVQAVPQLHTTVRGQVALITHGSVPTVPRTCASGRTTTYMGTSRGRAVHRRPPEKSISSASGIHSEHRRKTGRRTGQSDNNGSSSLSTVCNGSPYFRLLKHIARPKFQHVARSTARPQTLRPSKGSRLPKRRHCRET